STANNNSGYHGFEVYSANSLHAELTLDHCCAVGNGFSGFDVRGVNAIGRASDSSFLNNQQYGLENDPGGTLVSFGNNRIEGNGSAPMSGPITNGTLH